MFINLNISCYKNHVIVSFMFLYGCFSNVSEVAGSSVLLVMYLDKSRAHLLWYDPLLQYMICMDRGSGESSSYCSLWRIHALCATPGLAAFILLLCVFYCYIQLGLIYSERVECWFAHLNHVGLFILDVFRLWTGYKSTTLTDPLPNSAFGHSSFNSATLVYGL